MLGLLVALQASASLAGAPLPGGGEPATEGHALPGGSAADPSVSTSPEAGIAQPDAPRRGLPSQASPSLPLTRAATRQQVDEMSPLGWLSGYGDVVVGRPR